MWLDFVSSAFDFNNVMFDVSIFLYNVRRRILLVMAAEYFTGACIERFRLKFMDVNFRDFGESPVISISMCYLLGGSSKFIGYPSIGDG